ncbi:related to acriflavine sensitivity control protein ACR-2 [Cephalotrichum gorgonifer]|uniref:Related to acriflavine sensitivity control protein ACR-2 n=1 Tax=Cephalotrichum gorgonifer TaxID=2041049 RepID=A0AAE8SX56_9PEZI|nr:related to acriflavine sensitivity control protein ACR-2 [Cephalotrichum gorgonifer]
MRTTKPQSVAPHACHNCRRQRRKCDRSEPHCAKCASRGIECLGYGQLFLWTGGVASRGKLAGEASISSLLETLSTKRARTNPQLAVTRRGTAVAPGNRPAGPESEDVSTAGCSSLAQITPTNFGIAAPWALVDPLFQDMRPSDRRYLDYFSTRVCLDLVAHDVPDRNPFRNLIPLAHAHPLLHEVIISTSAAHMCNQARALLSLNPYSNRDIPSRWAMDSLVAKQKALQMMPAALQAMDTVGYDVILAAALFLVNIELIESGKNGWKPHLEGTRRIMSMIQPLAAADEGLRDYIMSDCLVYHILNSAFAPPAPDMRTQLRSWDLMAILEKTTNSYFCCPPEVLEIVHLASQLPRETEENTGSSNEVSPAGAALLHRAQSVDVLAWALKIREVPALANTSIGSRFRAGSAHRLALCLYIMQAAPSVQRWVGKEVTDVMMDDLHRTLEAIPPTDSNFKSTSWATFIFGATAKSPERKAWVIDRLRRLAVAYPWGYLNTSMETLQILWGLEAEGKLTDNWLPTLRDPQHNILVV